MNDNIRIAVNKIIDYTQRNQEFRRELIKALASMHPSYEAQTISNIQSDVSAIREALHIQANCSIKYDFIPKNPKYQRLRDQLIIDNLRMENAAIGLEDNEKERFYTFCVNAFYQIENIINYYFYVLYPSIDQLQAAIEEATKGENVDYRYHRSDKVETVADISISNKLNAFCNTVFPNDKIKIKYSQLRQVRNEGEHRCMVILEEKDESKSLYKFFRYNSFNSIRNCLIKLVNAVKSEINAQK